MIVKGGVILTMDSSFQKFENGFIIIDQGEIIELGKDTAILNQYYSDKTIDAGGKLILPGLINTHTHVPMTLFRGMADDLPLDEWLQNHIWPAEAKYINQETVYTGTNLAVAEMIRGGITTFNDMYFFEEEVALAASRAGIRAFVGEGLIDFPSPNSKTPEEAIQYTEMLIKKWAQHPLITITIAPHSPYASSEELLKKAKELADRHQKLLHIHLSETEKEVNDMVKARRMSPVAYLKQIGVLDSNVIAAHCVHLSSKDIDLLLETKTSVAHNPQSNMKLASGIAPVPQMLAKGVTVGLGTDGAASNNDLSLWEEMNSAALLHKVAGKGPTLMNSREVLAMATIGGARVLGVGDKIGSLEKGKKADLIIINLNQPHLSPVFNYYSHAVYSIDAGDVNDVIIEGKEVLRNRKLITIDEAEMLEDVKRIAAQIQE